MVLDSHPVQYIERGEVLRHCIQLFLVMFDMLHIDLVEWIAVLHEGPLFAKRS